MIPLTITDVRAVAGDSAFLIDDGITSVLCDTGFGFTGYAVADRVREVLGDRPLDYILLTHSHYDHALGSVYLRKRYPDAKVVAGAYAETIFRKPTARAVMRDLDRKAAASYGITEYEDLTNELGAAITVTDGDVIECGRMRFTAVELPGHTKCSVGFYLAENQLLLATETLGVYFGEGVYLPSFLVGYQMTLDSVARVKAIDVKQMLIPHYGLVAGEEMRQYLIHSEQDAKVIAEKILHLFESGKTPEEILGIITELLYTERVKNSYPYDAFRLNAQIMINLVQKELL